MGIMSHACYHGMHQRCIGNIDAIDCSCTCHQGKGDQPVIDDYYTRLVQEREQKSREAFLKECHARLLVYGGSIQPLVIQRIETRKRETLVLSEKPEAKRYESWFSQNLDYDEKNHCITDYGYLTIYTADVIQKIPTKAPQTWLLSKEPSNKRPYFRRAIFPPLSIASWGSSDIQSMETFVQPVQSEMVEWSADLYAYELWHSIHFSMDRKMSTITDYGHATIYKSWVWRQIA